VIPKVCTFLLVVGSIGCKPTPPPPISQEREIPMVQMEKLVLAGKAIKAGSNHSGDVWIEVDGGQVLFTKRGRLDFQEFVTKNAPKSVDFYIE